MIKTSNYTSNCVVICQEAINEWNNIKKKSVNDIDEIIQNYITILLNLYDIQSMRYRYSISIEKMNPFSFSFTIYLVDSLPKISANTLTQKRIVDAI